MFEERTCDPADLASLQERIKPHIMVAFLGYCLWVCLKHKLKPVAGSITPTRALESLRAVMMVDVWFVDLRDRRKLCMLS